MKSSLLAHSVLIFCLLCSTQWLRADTIVLADPFTAAEPTPIALADPERQSGEIAPLEFILGCRGVDCDQVPIYLDERGLVLENNAATFASVTPANNLSEAGGDAFRIRVDIQPEPGSGAHSPDRWAQIHFGAGVPNRLVFQWGFGILIRSDSARNDGYQIFHNGEYVASGRVPVTEVYSFDIVVEDGELSFAINGELQTPFEDGSPTHPVGSLRLGYLTLGSHYNGAVPMVSIFSNLSVERLDVESGSVLVLSSLSEPPPDTAPFALR